MCEIIRVQLWSIERNGETAIRGHSPDLQGVAVFARSEDEARADAAELVAALRRSRGESEPFEIDFEGPLQSEVP